MSSRYKGVPNSSQNWSFTPNWVYRTICFRKPNMLVVQCEKNLLFQQEAKQIWQDDISFCALFLPALIPMETIIQETIEYTRQRKVFGQPVLHNQTVHFRLAELATEVELLRSLLHRAVGELPHLLPRCASLRARNLVRLKEHGEVISRVTAFLSLLFFISSLFRRQRCDKICFHG